MPEIKFSNDKAERWLNRLGKRLNSLTPENVAAYEVLLAVHQSGGKLDAQQAKELWVLGKQL